MTNPKPSKLWFKVLGFFIQGEPMQKLVTKLDAIFPPECVFVEIGSWHGRSTCCIAQSLRKHKLIAIDPHEGLLQNFGHDCHVNPTLESFRRNLKECGVEKRVEIIKERSENVVWDGRPICFLFIDGYHDERHVLQDFEKFYPFMVPNAAVVFHDYGTKHYPGVTEAVDQIMATHDDFGKPAKDKFMISFRVKINEAN